LADQVRDGFGRREIEKAGRLGDAVVTTRTIDEDNLAPVARPRPRRSVRGRRFTAATGRRDQGGGGSEPTSAARYCDTR
jgi:hypothetical protein